VGRLAYVIMKDLVSGTQEGRERDERKEAGIRQM
jgi:hypothetical protein